MKKYENDYIVSNSPNMEPEQAECMICGAQKETHPQLDYWLCSDSKSRCSNCCAEFMVSVCRELVRENGEIHAKSGKLLAETLTNAIKTQTEMLNRIKELEEKS